MNSLIRLSTALLTIISLLSLLMVLFFPVNIMENTNLSQIDVRTKSNTFKGDVIGSIKPSSNVICFGKKGEWAKIIYTGKSGYVKFSLLSPKKVLFQNSSIKLDTILKVTLGLIFLISIFVLSRMKENKNAHSVSQSLRIEAKNRISKKNDSRLNSTSLEESVEFDKFILNKFNSNKYFRFIEWLGDENSRTPFSKSNMRPNLKFEFNVGQYTYQLAVENRWYNKYDSDIEGIKWSDEKQFESFHLYQKSNSIPVFVVIGLGGWSYQPKYLFMVPLSQLESPSVKMNTLYQYKNDPNKLIYFDHKANTLSTI